jgi:hypothetical protein
MGRGECRVGLVYIILGHVDPEPGQSQSDSQDSDLYTAHDITPVHEPDPHAGTKANLFPFCFKMGGKSGDNWAIARKTHNSR